MLPWILPVLLFPALIDARIKVTIVASDHPGDTQLHISGSDAATISDTEATTFGLTEETLRTSIHSYFGQTPDHAYLKSPTPWGDLYKTYSWPEVTRVLTPLKARILTFDQQPVVLATHVYNNTNVKPAKVTAKMHQRVQNTIATMWETTGDLTPNDIDYEFDVKSQAILDNHWFTHTAKWGEDTVKTEAITVGLESVEITLDPKQSAVAELQAMKGVMRIQMDYEATLTGAAAVNFDKGHQGHHFWAFGIDSVMAAGDMKRSVKSSEIIEVTFYTDPKLVVTNTENGQMLYSIPMKIY